MMRRILAGVLVVSAITAATVTGTVADRPSPGGLTVHEWGTFTTVAGEDGNAIDWFPLGGPSDLPCFVERVRNKGPAAVPRPVVTLPGVAAAPIPNLANAAASIQGKVAGVVITAMGFDYEATRANVMGKVRMETPVIYFYAPTEMTARVRVDFPRGLMTEWYPRATVTQGDVGSVALRDSSTVGVIEWKNVRIMPSVRPPSLSNGGTSHYFAARATDAAPVLVDGQTEKFLFYRGVANFDVPLSAEVLPGDAIRVRNRGTDPLPGMILFENRGGRIGFRVQRTLDSSVTLSPPALTGSRDSLRTVLERMLVDAGLYKKEAAAMVATWRDSWFEEGTRVFYLFSPRSVDAALPLQVSPAPVSVARVFVGRMEVVTSATQNAVSRAIATNDVAALEQHARFFGPIADRLLSGTDDVNGRLRFRKLANGMLGTYVKKMASCE